MSDFMDSNDELIRLTALKAAKDAAEHIAGQTAKKTPTATGAFALYTWGSLAFLSLIFAFAIGVSPHTFVWQPARIAKFDQVKPRSPSETKDTALVEVSRSIPVQPRSDHHPAAFVDSSPNKSAKALPEPLPVPVNLARDGDDNRLQQHRDSMETGSIEKVDGNELQPMPTNQLASSFFAVDLGGADAVTPLVDRYAALLKRAPGLFSGLEPRIQLTGQDGKLEARLVAGPFSTSEDIAMFCRAVRLQLTIDCKKSTFEGESVR
ncbi:MAG: hypothetical protein ACR2O8_05245 [Rhizobiaceae bacterium]